MDAIKMHSSEIFGAGMQFHYAFITELSAVSALHTHDFYELFLIIKGEITHVVNGGGINMKEGELALIRPDDRHCYERSGRASCMFVNLAFTVAVARDAFCYLGSDFQRYLSKLEQPPCVNVQEDTRKRLIKILRDVGAMPEKDTARKTVMLKILLIELLAGFPAEVKAEETEIPAWLAALCGSMQSIENFTSGMPAMYSLSRCSPEHLSRTFKKYLMSTPTQYVNDLRLNYIRNLLVDTDLGITEICTAAGYNSISHANHLFRDKYGMPPSGYRAANKRIVIP